MENNVEKMLDGVGHVGVKVKTRHHKLPREAVGHDFRKERSQKSSDSPPPSRGELPARFLDAFLNQLGDVHDARCNT